MGEIFNKLKNYADSDFLPMHMPGHKRKMGNIGNPFLIDITEIEGFDNLHHASGMILNAQKRAASLYHSEECHFLINGSTAGVLAAISGCTSFGGKILMARNSHKSAYHAVLLKGLHVEYLYPSLLKNDPHSPCNLGLNGTILPEDVENSLKKHPEIQSVFLTSPTYDGVVSDIEAIAKIVHAYGIPLIVDEAHGAHFPFSSHFPKDSISCGADIVIHSLHKTLPAFTQSALIHFNGDRFDRDQVCEYLTVYQTSSPSYVLMAGIDNCLEWIAAHPQSFENFWERLKTLHQSLHSLNQLHLIEIPGMDPSKILISVQNTEINGRELAKHLREQFHIELEMACHSYVCAITSVCDTDRDLLRFSDALCKIDKSLKRKCGKKGGCLDQILPADNVCTIQEASQMHKISCSLENAKDCISGSFITLYPPGIPILAPGEVISVEILEKICGYIRNGFEIQGIKDNKIQILTKKNHDFFIQKKEMI